MTEGPAPTAPRCADCAYFHSVRLDAAKGVDVGECAHGVWPPVRPASSSCPDFVTRGSLARHDGGASKPKRASTSRDREREPVKPAGPRAPVEIEVDMDESTFRTVLREILSEELGIADAPIADRWRGGELVIKPGKAGTQEKRVPIDKFFHKIIMVRDKLRVLEQRINGHAALPEEDKLTLQQYITAVYGSLTTFNFLFREEGDKLSGAAGSEKE